MDNFFELGGRLPHDFVVAASCDVLKETLKHPQCYLSANDEPMLFHSGYEAVLKEYLLHHAISEQNQHLLFEPENADVLEHFISYWSLASVFEAKLFDPPYRSRYLMKYLQLHRFADSGNEKLLFQPNMQEYRRCYISKSEFYNSEAEAKLLEHEFADDLAFYVLNGRSFYPNNLTVYKQLVGGKLVSRP
jgi:hypothetical protein